MRLYLVRHGEAFGEEVDPERPLTLQGRADVDTVAAFAARRRDITIGTIHHSGKRRAEQTAELIAEHLKLQSVEAAEGLGPNDSPSVWADRLREREDSLMLVGHLPHLSRLVSLLVTGQAEKTVVRIPTAGMVVLGRDEEGGWGIEWMLTPDVVS